MKSVPMISVSMKSLRQLAVALSAITLSALSLYGCQTLILGQSGSPTPPPDHNPEISFIIAEGAFDPRLYPEDPWDNTLPVEPVFTEPTIIFGAKTKFDGYPCANYHIPTDISRQGSNITIELGNPTLPGDICYTAFGPAAGFAPLDLNPGSYTLTITWNGMTEHATLQVTTKTLTVKTPNPVFTDLQLGQVERFQENTFLFQCYEDVNGSLVCNDLADSLVNKFNLTEIFYPVDETRPFRNTGRYFKYPANTEPDVMRAYLQSLFDYEKPARIYLTDWLYDYGRARSVQ